MYSSINEICNEFNIKYSDDIDKILRELTEIQSKLHPDNYPNTDKINTEKYFRVSEAKNYIRKNYKQKHNSKIRKHILGRQIYYCRKRLLLISINN